MSKTPNDKQMKGQPLCNPPPFGSAPITQSAETAQSFFNRTLVLPLGWIFFAAILLFEWSLFVHFVQREILWGYPMSFDQITYLERSYKTFNQMLTQGPVNGFVYGLRIPVSQGVMIHPQAALLYLLIGPSRLSALILNFLYFAIFQGLLVYTLRWFSGRWSVAFYGLGLLLATISRYGQAGGLADFRIDFIASCIFGSFICLAIRSKLFESWPWSLATALAAALLILFRFLTAPAVLVIGSVMLLGFVLRLVRRKHDAVSQTKNRRRIKRLTVCAGLVATLIIPAICLNRNSIFGYYIGHLTSHENQIRNAEFGVNGTLSSLLFYPRSLCKDHLGPFFWYTCAVTLLIGAAFSLRGGVKHRAMDMHLPVEMDEIAVFLLVCLSSPLLILTIFPSPSPVVGNIMVPPLVGLVLITVLAVADRSRRRDSGGQTSENATWALAAISVCAGAYVNLSLVSRHSLLSDDPADVRKIVHVYEHIGQTSVELGWTNPRIAMDRIHDYLYPTMIAPVFYERDGILLNAMGLLGMQVSPVAEPEAVSAIRESDFAVLTEPGSVEQDPSIPFNSAMKSIEDQLVKVADRELFLLERVDVFSQRLAVYMRQPLRLEGVSGDWITSDGATLVSPAEFLRARPTVDLSGTTILSSLYGGNWNVSAQLLIPGRTTKDISTTITAPAEQYAIELKLDPETLPANGDVRIHFALDKFFIPKDNHLNMDTRHLSIMKPQRIVAHAP